MESDSLLDKAVTKISIDIINDISKVDPRWAAVRAKKPSMGCSPSFNLLTQLEDKLKKMDCYYAFLKDFKLWHKVNK